LVNLAEEIQAKKDAEEQEIKRHKDKIERARIAALLADYGE
jgi:hypothetical protein